MWWSNRRTDKDFHREIDAHITLETDRLVADGMAPEEARAAARRAFGNITMREEQFHDSQGAAFLDRLVQDLRYTFRLLRQNPGLTAAVLATLAIGVGANTAIFSVMRGVILRPLPYESPEQLVMVWRVGKNTPPPGRGIVTSLYALEWRARSECFSDVALLEPRNDVDATGPDGTERFRSFLVTPNFFALMGVAATRGRTFTENDPPDVVVLSHGMWQRRFGSDPGIVGRRIELTTGFSPNRESRLWTVVGVMPPSFRFTYPQDTDLWIPYSWDELKRRNAATLGLQVIARIKPGMSLASAQAHMDTVMTAMGRSLSSSYGMPQDYRQLIQSDISQSSARLETVQDYVVGQTRPAFVLLALVTIFLLGVACVNVACLIVARTAGRSREIAVRLALGGGAARIRFQLFIEGLVLALMGGLAGITLAAVLQPILRASIPLAFPRADEVQFDLTTTAWGLGVALIAAIVAGLAPTLSLSTINVNAMLRQGGPTATSDQRSTWWRQSLVAGQVALVMTILIVSGLLLHTLWRLQRVNLGFTSSDVLVVHLRTGTPATKEWRERLMTRLRSVPGILDVGVTSAAPMRSGVLPMVSGQGGMQAVVTGSGRQSVFLVSADMNYFNVLGIPLRAGRVFGTADGRSDEFVALLSDAAGRLLFSDEDPIGKTVSLPPWGTARIVGVLGDVRYRRADEPTAPVVYVPFAQRPHGNMVLVARTADGLTARPAAIRAVVREVDPKQPIESMAMLDELVTDSIADRRFYAVSTMAFSTVALLLTAAGLYGVVSRGVVEQVREIGIRMALGAQRGHLIRLIMRQGLRPVGVGLVAGGIGVMWASNLLRRFLFEVEPLDALTFMGVPALVVLVTAATCAIPAYRALRVNPIEAIRSN